MKTLHKHESLWLTRELMCKQLWVALRKRRSDVEEAFKAFDDDGNGKLSEAEFEHVIVSHLQLGCTLLQVRSIMKEINRVNRTEANNRITFEGLERYVEAWKVWSQSNH